MRKTHQLIIVAVCITMQITSGCNKKEDTPSQNVNTAPKSLGGFDQLVILPFNSPKLEGKAFDKETPGKQLYEWRKIKGPESYTIENKNGPEAALGNLVKGDYEFERRVKVLWVNPEETQW